MLEGSGFFKKINPADIYGNIDLALARAKELIEEKRKVNELCRRLIIIK